MSAPMTSPFTLAFFSGRQIPSGQGISEARTRRRHVYSGWSNPSPRRGRWSSAAITCWSSAGARRSRREGSPGISCAPATPRRHGERVAVALCHAAATDPPDRAGLGAAVSDRARAVRAVRAAPPAQASWSSKPLPTVADALASVRREFWQSTISSTSPNAPDTVKMPRAVLNRLTDLACYPA
jgi:hypothetical protein